MVSLNTEWQSNENKGKARHRGSTLVVGAPKVTSHQ